MARVPFLSPERRKAATPALGYTYDELEKAAIAAGATTVGPAANTQPLIAAMTTYLNTFPRAAPSNDVKQRLPDLLTDAIVRQYPVQNQAVLEALVDFALSERTDGYIDKDTTGTLIGGRVGRGGLRGMGFSDD